MYTAPKHCMSDETNVNKGGDRIHTRGGLKQRWRIKALVSTNHHLIIVIVIVIVIIIIIIIIIITMKIIIITTITIIIIIILFYAFASFPLRVWRRKFMVSYSKHLMCTHTCIHKHTHTHTKHLSIFLFTHSTTPYFNPFALHIFHTRIHCSHPSILSRHMLLSDNSFPQHALLTAMLYSMNKSLIHTAILAGEYGFLTLS